MTAPSVKKLISGGQTGVDRGALDAALSLKIAVGGWCPAGRRAEDGVIPGKYDFLKETPSKSYVQRTAWNVRDSNATLVLHGGALGPGSKKTVKIAEETKKPVLVIDLGDAAGGQRVSAWLNAHHVEVLNVAGPRGSADATLEQRTREFLVACLGELIAQG